MMKRRTVAISAGASYCRILEVNRGLLLVQQVKDCE